MENRLIIAAAGSGKTTYVVRDALSQSDNVLITTYTVANSIEIKKKFLEINGCVPHNVIIQTWDAFLLKHGVRPFQGGILEDKINGMILVNEKSGVKCRIGRRVIYYGEEKDLRNHYFTKKIKIYSDKIAKFVCRCDELSQGAVIGRISKCFSKVYIDEVQDLSGYDLEIIKRLLHANCNLLMVGDPRQVTYHTHYEAKYNKYTNGNIEGFLLKECKGEICIIDRTTLNDSYRNNKDICVFSSKLYPDFDEPGSNQIMITKHDGVFLIKPENISQYMKEFNPVQLRENKRVRVEPGYLVINMGEAKGLTYDRVLIYPTNDMMNWVKDHTVDLADKTRAHFYVAITRAKYSVGIVCKYNDLVNINGVKIYMI